jgi:hypothetical protein
MQFSSLFPFTVFVKKESVTARNIDARIDVRAAASRNNAKSAFSQGYR